MAAHPTAKARAVPGDVAGLLRQLQPALADLEGLPIDLALRLLTTEAAALERLRPQLAEVPGAVRSCSACSRRLLETLRGRRRKH
jgi:hypothetical protein